VQQRSTRQIRPKSDQRLELPRRQRFQAKRTQDRPRLASNGQADRLGRRRDSGFATARRDASIEREGPCVSGPFCARTPRAECPRAGFQQRERTWRTLLASPLPPRPPCIATTKGGAGDDAGADIADRVGWTAWLGPLLPFKSASTTASAGEARPDKGCRSRPATTRLAPWRRRARIHLRRSCAAPEFSIAKVLPKGQHQAC
jgi:hypothetical protein